MAPELTHAELQELLGAYAVDAVDADEAALVEAHLRECPRCRAEVAEHREAAALLAHSGTTAPEAVWERIASSLGGAAPPVDAPRVVPFRRRGIPVRLAAGVAAAAVLVTAVLGAQVVRQDHRIDRLAAISDRRGLEQAAAAAAVTPGARTVRLRSDDGGHVADAVVLPDGHGYLVEARLPGLRTDETYQLWGVLGARTISLGVLGDDPAVTSFKAAGPLTALAITIERTGGAVAPTTTPIVQGFVSTD